ncbi:predicted protein [Sparassis crispa]|uniref:Cytochrome b-c1 complex subunit 10 n=1 Tax=Sparassis crispa TaxID=139825 RepID=A0A401GJK1_9APHY|nr:predicted protein [Sparassis crispa]GBE82348.1 predicted protein [Sparassis crispa]
MSRVLFQRTPIHRISLNLARTWGTSAGWWGVGAGIYVLYLLSVTPLVKRDFLSKVPLVGSYYADKIPASDKPF